MFGVDVVVPIDTRSVYSIVRTRKVREEKSSSSKGGLVWVKSARANSKTFTTSFERERTHAPTHRDTHAHTQTLVVEVPSICRLCGHRGEPGREEAARTSVTAECIRTHTHIY